MEKNIITILIKQHHDLQTDLSFIVDQTDSIIISEGLAKFKTDLDKHLDLENNQFYPVLLQAMENKGQDTGKTKKFISEMDVIGKEVLVFLEKYNTSENITENIGKFKEELNKITQTLNIRIESEEVGVYSYWGLF